MPYSVSNRSLDEVCKMYKSLEDNPQDVSPGPAINNLPAVRGSQGGHHFEGAGTKKEK